MIIIIAIIYPHYFSLLLHKQYFYPFATNEAKAGRLRWQRQERIANKLLVLHQAVSDDQEAEHQVATTLSAISRLRPCPPRSDLGLSRNSCVKIETVVPTAIANNVDWGTEVSWE